MAINRQVLGARRAGQSIKIALFSICSYCVVR
jgi:hypothetical protein